MKKFFADFKAFALKGNVVDMAVGVIIGGAFGAIVTSLINDIIMPLLGLLIKVDFTSWGVVLCCGSRSHGVLLRQIHLCDRILYPDRACDLHRCARAAQSGGKGRIAQEEGRTRGRKEAAHLPVLQDGDRGRRNPLPALHQRASGRISKSDTERASRTPFFRRNARRKTCCFLMSILDIANVPC